MKAAESYTISIAAGKATQVALVEAALSDSCRYYTLHHPSFNHRNFIQGCYVALIGQLWLQQLFFTL